MLINIISANILFCCFSAEALKYCEDTTPMVTLRRVMDLTYRLNAGTVKYSINLVKDVTDPVAWVRH